MALENNFNFWSEYWGLLLNDKNAKYPISIYGYENISTQYQALNAIEIENNGTAWGFVQSGEVLFTVGSLDWKIKSGQWFCLQQAQLNKINLVSHSRLFVVFFKAHQGLNSMGGPIEEKGRLRYIDNCTDTILYSPPVKGDPCLNFLHFPAEVTQSAHFHPTSRCGIVVSGLGTCEVGEASYTLNPGKIFYLPADASHRFCTPKDSFLNVITFHPDSDYGPTHEIHPMINRTWFGPSTQ